MTDGHGSQSIPSGDIPNTIGPYHIERELGRGGMGVVYLARDPRLDRLVAIKLLPAEVERDPERLARFEREARVLATLNHPNIATIYSVEQTDSGNRFLVLEFVEGESLDDMLERGPLSVRQALNIAGQMARAIAAAHSKGVVHRDIKPGNVMVTDDMRVKVLDFGLSMRESKGAAAGADDETRVKSRSLKTIPGKVMGTAGYMSPEQARGKPVDKRTDIWSFGCVLFNCLTGKPAFEGETTTDIIAATLTADPDWKLLPPATPQRIRNLLGECLAKEPDERLAEIDNALSAIEAALSEHVSSGAIASARYGNYETIEEIKQGTRASVWLVRRVDGPAPASPGPFVAKIIEPSALILGTEHARLRVDGFMDAVRTQKTVAAQGECAHWMPIHESGRITGGAYYVTDQYKWSAEDLATYHQRLTAPELHHIVTSIVRGLRELEQTQQRPHGNLKPTNVLIDAEGGALTNARVCLTDPLGRDQLVADQRQPSDDLADLGRLIYRLVVHEDWRGRVGANITYGPEWKQLGRHGQKWHELCQHLLGFDPGTLDDLESRLEQMKPSSVPIRPIAMTTGGVAAVLVLILVIPTILSAIRSEPAPVAAPNDEEVVREVTPLDTYHAAHTNWAWALDRPRDRDALFAILTDDEADSSAQDLADALQHAIDEQPIPDPADVRSHDEAEDGLRKIQPHRSALTGWLDDLARRAARMNELGWSGPATELQQRRDRLHDLVVAEQAWPLRSDDDFLARIEQAVAINALAAHYLDQWETITSQAERFARTEDPLLEQFDRYAREESARELGEAWRPHDARAPQALDKILSLAASIAEFVESSWDELNEQLVREDPPIPYRAGDEVSRDHYRLWLRGIRADCYRRHDPRDVDWQPDRALADIQRLADELRVEYEHELGSRLEREIAQTNELVQTTQEMPWRCEDQTQIEENVERLAGDLHRLRQELSAQLAAVSTTVEEFFANQPSELVTGSETINRAWREVLAEAEGRQLSLVDSRSRVEALQKTLTDLDLDFEVLDDEVLRGRSWQRDLRAFKHERREAQLAEAIESIDLSEVLATGSPVAPRRWSDYSRAFADFAESVVDLAGRFGAIERRFDEAYDWREPGPDGVTVRDMVAAGREVDAYREHDKVRQIVQRIDQRANNLAAVENQTSADILAELAQRDGGTPEIRRAAWRRLGADDVRWTNRYAALHTERDLYSRLGAEFEQLPVSDSRRQELHEELDRELARRWIRHVAHLRDRESLESAISMRHEFGIDRDGQETDLPPAVRFNVQLHAFRSAISAIEAGDDEDDAVRTAVSEFEQWAAAYQPRAGEAAEDIEKVISQLAALLEPDDEPATDWSRVGFGRIGWDHWISDDERVIRFMPPEEYTRSTAVTFLLVEPEDAEPAYLSAHEMPMGVFMDLMDHAGAGEAVWNLTRAAERETGPTGSRRAPRGWHWADPGRMVISDGWVGDEPRDLYAREINTPAAPAEDHPMHAVSPAAAAFLATRVGCRLPTKDEWREAYRRGGRQALLENANLRGRTWVQQRDYILQVNQNFAGWAGTVDARDIGRYFEPNENAFLPDELRRQRDTGDGWTNEDGELIDDGTLWFRPVLENDQDEPTFENVVGNVAEFVVDRAVLSDLFPGTRHADPAALRGVMTNAHTPAAAGIFVIGASAVSRPEIQPDEPYPVPARRPDWETSGYADVGFRLVLPADGITAHRTLRQQVVEVLDEQPYLVARGPDAPRDTPPESPPDASDTR